MMRQRVGYIYTFCGCEKKGKPKKRPPNQLCESRSVLYKFGWKEISEIFCKFRFSIGNILFFMSHHVIDEAGDVFFLLRHFELQLNCGLLYMNGIYPCDAIRWFICIKKWNSLWTCYTVVDTRMKCMKNRKQENSHKHPLIYCRQMN